LFARVDVEAAKVIHLIESKGCAGAGVAGEAGGVLDDHEHHQAGKNPRKVLREGTFPE